MRKKNLIVSIVLSSALFCIFYCTFEFERKVEGFSNISPKWEQLTKIRTDYVGQNFVITKNNKDSSLYQIEIAISDYKKDNNHFLFTLKEQKNGPALYNDEIDLKDKLDTTNFVTISFPGQLLRNRDRAYFEIKSKYPFVIYTKKGRNLLYKKELSKYLEKFVGIEMKILSFASFCLALAKKIENEIFVNSYKTYISNKPIEKFLMFGTYFKETISIASFFFLRSGSKIKMIGSFLMMLSWTLIFFCCYYFISKIPIFNENRCANGNRLSTSDNVIVITGLALFILCYILCAFLIGNNTYSSLICSQDDSFISYKYARNISEGNGFRFNLDEKVLGTTTPLYTLLLSFFGLFSGNFPMISILISFFSIVLSSIVLNYAISRRFSTYTGLAGGLIFIFFPIFYRVIDMETNFLIMLITLSIFMFSEKKYNWAFFFSGLATLTRIESLLLIPIFIIHLLFRKEYGKILKSSAIYIITILPWFIFSYLYFGNLLPNTFYVKTAVGYTGETVLNKFIFLIKHIIGLKFLKSVFFTGFFNYAPIMIQNYFIWIWLFFFGLLLSIKDIIKFDFLRLFALWVLLYVFSFSVLNVPLFIWYFVLAYAIIPVILVIGINNLLKHFPKLIKSRTSQVYMSGIVLISLLMFGGNGIFNFFYGQWYSKNSPRQERFETYVKISEYTNKNIPKEKSIAMEEIGIVGYFIDNKIWDFYCLVHRAELFPHYFPAESRNRIPYLLTLMDPDLILVNSFRAKSSVVFQNYNELRIFRVDGIKSHPGFYYSLLEKSPDQFVVLGGITLNKMLTGNIKINGWAFGTKPVDRVEVLVKNEIIAKTDTFFDNSPEFTDYFGFNRYAKKSAFIVHFDSKTLTNGRYILVFRAKSGFKSGIFAKKIVKIINKTKLSKLR